MIRLALILLMLQFGAGWDVRASQGGAPKRTLHLVESDISGVLQENALYFAVLTGVSITQSISDPVFGFDVDHVNLNFITRDLRDGLGRQRVVFRVGGVVRSNNNVELNLLDAGGRVAGDFFYGYRSGDLLSHDRNGRLVIQGYVDSSGRFVLSDLRLPEGERLLASGRFTWCGGCPGFDYVWYDAEGFLLASGFIYFWPVSSFPNGVDRIRVGWFNDGGTLGSVPTLLEAEYDLRKESTGALNSNLFDRRPDALSFFNHPYDLVTPPPGLGWIPRVTDRTTISIVNDAPVAADITLTARHFDGTLLRGSGIVNPISFRFDPHLQATALPHEFFREFSVDDRRLLLPPGSLPVWVEVASDQQDVRVLYFDEHGADLEGAMAADAAQSEFLLDNLLFYPGRQREVSILNLSHEPTTVQLEVLDNMGSVLELAENFYIPARGFRNFVLGVFPEVFKTVDFSRVTTLRTRNTTNTKSLAAAVLHRSPEGALEASHHRYTGEASDTLWVPFYVTGRDITGLWSTRVAVTEVLGRDTDLLLEFFTTEGVSQLTQRVTVKSWGSWSAELFELLGEPDHVIRGYVRITATGRILGSISFTYESIEGSAASTLTLPATPDKRHDFHQMVQGVVGQSTYYTGIVFLNPAEENARITVSAIDARGQQTATTEFDLAPGAGRIDLLDSLFGSPFRQVGGSLSVLSQVPIFCQVLFGDTRGSLLSVVPSVK